MARVLQEEALAEARDDAIEIVGERRLAEDQLQFRHGDQRLADGIAVGAQAVGHLEQDAVDLAHLLFGEAHQFVVEVDGLERLDEERVAAGTGGVDHAIDLAALSGDHRDHEALVADGDELLLQHAFLAVGAQEALQRFLDRLLLPLDIAAQARQRDAGVVGHAAVGQDLAVEFAQQGAELADGRRRGVPSSGKRSAAAARCDLASAATSSRVNSSKISLGSSPAPSMRSLCTAGSTSGMPPNSMRSAAPRPPDCGCRAACRY